MLRHLWSEIFRKGRRPMLKPKDIAPDFEVQDHLGATVRLSDFKGKRVVLWFYPKADTPGCTKEACGFRDRFSEYAQRGVEVFGISFDDVASNRAFAEKFRVPYRLLSDPERKVGIAYKACDNAEERYAKRFTYVIGPDGRIEQAIDTKDPGAQAGSLLASL
jgi:peroxiredoxin Q/BCP